MAGGGSGVILARGNAAAPVLAEADVAPLSMDLSARLRVLATVLGGNKTPGDAVAVPTDAIDARAWLELLVGATGSLARGRAWSTSLGTETASVAALETIGMLVGPDGTNLRRARVNTGGALTVASLIGDIDASGDNYNYGSTALMNVYANILGQVESSLPSALTTARKSGVRLDQYGQLIVSPGVPAPNTRHNPSGTFIVDSNDANVSSTAKTLWSITVWSTEATNVRYLQVFDKASALSGGDTPIAGCCWRLAAGAMLQIPPNEIGPAGVRCASGLRIGWSSSAATYTAAATPKVEARIAYF